jgi:hypothetical protein
MSYCKLRRNNGATGGCAPDKPSNPGLASENNKKLEAIIAERAKQDALLFGQAPNNNINKK